MTIIFRAIFVGTTVRFFSTFLLFFLLFSSTAQSSTTFTGKVVNVADGDTITVLTVGNQSVKVRLAGIDCPEGGQAFGNKAKQFLAAKVAGKRVRIVPESTDRYGRTIGMVFLNGLNVNEQIIANGYGWVYRQYCTASHCDGWLKKEAAARKAKLGLWRDKNPQAPWDWRAEKRGGGGSVSSAGSSVPVVGESATGRTGSVVYHGNQKTKVFHGPSCQYYNCKNCVVKFRSIEEAKRAKFRAHRECVKE
jgi:endonuclease YncB( thermonuclease family)